MEGKELQNRFSYEFEAWKNTIGFEPVKLLATADNAGSYEKSELHVFKLKRGFAVVNESGCSCYEARDANIELFPSMPKLKDSLRTRARENYGDGHLAKEILLKLLGEWDKDS